MKIHPLFDNVILMMAYGMKGDKPFRDWRNAGSPVVEEEHSPSWWQYAAEEHDKKLRNAVIDEVIKVLEKDHEWDRKEIMGLKR